MSYWYLGSPYSKYPEGIEAAWVDVCRNAALLIKAGVPIFSPIAHTHPIAVFGYIDPLAHEVWLPADYPFMKAAAGLIVLRLVTWEESIGLDTEINLFRKWEKPVIFMDPGTVPDNLLFVMRGPAYRRSTTPTDDLCLPGEVPPGRCG